MQRPTNIECCKYDETEKKIDVNISRNKVMKKIIFILISSILLSCSGKQKEVEEYIRKTYPTEITSLNIRSVSDNIDVYSVESELRSIEAICVGAYSNMTKLRKEAWESKDKENTIRILKRASNEINTIEIGTKLDLAKFHMGDSKFKSENGIKTKAISVEYDINGKIKSSLFYLDDNNKIVMADYELMDLYNQVVIEFNKASDYATKCVLESGELEFK